MKSSKQTVRCKSKEIAINGEEMYLRLLAINAYKQVPLKRVMSFENATVPLSLFTDDGEMISPTKSDFMHKLEEKVAEEITITVENVGCMLFDGMAVIQMLQPETSKKTYRDMTNMFWKYIMSNSKGVKRVKMFFDRYVPDSSKSQTRTKRGDVDSQPSCHIQSDMKIPEWKMSLKNCRSKLYTLFLAENPDILIYTCSHNAPLSQFK